jgi:2-isopropylmalate synthase
MNKIALYDTTLRDGSQREGLSFSLADKLKITEWLDRLGIDYVEGGWPGSNPKDREYFERVADLPLAHAQVTAFGSTRRAGIAVEDDPHLAALLDARTAVIAVFGKSWHLHVAEVLQTTPEENLRMIAETIHYLREGGRRVLYDAEHFFDGYRDDAAYALETLRAAAEAGAEVAVLCDTNGGTLPSQVASVVETVKRVVSIPLGIHAHNDIDAAVAATIAAVEAGAGHVQGTINGYGERCGNANLCSIIPTLQLKLGHVCIRNEQLTRLSETAHAVSELANERLDPHLAYVGSSAFAHKGGMHVDALRKNAATYQHIDPSRVGNQTRIVISELAGRSNVVHKAEEFGLTLGSRDTASVVLSQIKELEGRGFQFEGAEGSVELMILRTEAGYRPPFDLVDFHVLIRGGDGGAMAAEATVKVRVGERTIHTAADGNGPVNALDAAIRKALLPAHPQLADVRLTDYKVRILDGACGTAAQTRVLITSSDGARSWSTVGCSDNIIEASWIALADALEYALCVARSPVPVTAKGARP